MRVGVYGLPPLTDKMPPITRSRSQKDFVPKKEEAKTDLAKKYWWFCGHPTATIVSIKHHMHACEECPQSRLWEYFYVNGQLRTGT